MSIPGRKSQHGFFCCGKDVTDDSTRRQVWAQIDQQRAAFSLVKVLSVGELLRLFNFSGSHKAGLILRSPNLDAFSLFLFVHVTTFS